MKTEMIGQSVSGLPLFSYDLRGEKKNQSPILILSGVHGDEPEGIWAGKSFLGEALKKEELFHDLVFIPVLNPDGFFQNRRTNENKIDLNRNLPTKDWTEKFEKEKYRPGPEPLSEPENKALIQWIKSHQPRLILSLHSWKPLINVNGKTEPYSSILSQETGYKIAEDIGYPTPGSLGSYGQENQIPVITYEIERGSSFKKVLTLHTQALKKAFQS